MPIENRAAYNIELNGLTNSLVTGLLFSVDVFFYIAGFLMSYLTVQELQRKGKDFSWTSHFIRRVIRYLPAYLFLIGVERAGPAAPPETPSMLIFYLIGLNKTTPWWTALCFVQNFADKETAVYLSWTWTICADFHFFIVSSLVVCLYNKNKSIGYFSAFFVIAASVFYTGITAFVHKIRASTCDFSFDQAQMNLLYYHSLARIIPYMAGVVLGFVFLASKKKEFSVAYSVKDGFGERFEKQCLMWFENKRIRTGLYCVGLSLMGVCVLSIYFFARNGDEFIGQGAKSVWLASKLGLFSVGFAVFAFSLKLGHLKLISGVLKAKVFRLSSRISYSLYLIHPIVILICLSTETLLAPDIFFSAATAVKVYCISGIISAFVYVIVESPFYLLERRYLAR